jgi:hypothetical protein
MGTSSASFPFGSDTDRGVIGRFYNMLPTVSLDVVLYLWLSQASFSAEWLVAITAWEEDLEAEVEEL